MLILSSESSNCPLDVHENVGSSVVEFSLALSRVLCVLISVKNSKPLFYHHFISFIGVKTLSFYFHLLA